MELIVTSLIEPLPTRLTGEREFSRMILHFMTFDRFPCNEGLRAIGALEPLVIQVRPDVTQHICLLCESFTTERASPTVLKGAKNTNRHLHMLQNWKCKKCPHKTQIAVSVTSGALITGLAWRWRCVQREPRLAQSWPQISQVNSALDSEKLVSSPPVFFSGRPRRTLVGRCSSPNAPVFLSAMCLEIISSVVAVV